MSTSPILARADALMHRARQSNGEIDDLPVLTDAVVIPTSDADDDVPVLLDVEHFAPLAEPEPVIDQDDAPAAPDDIAETAALPAFDAGLRDIIAHELARRIEQRLAAELPRIIEATVRDYLAEQEKIATLQLRD
ncbi:hypothetical protein [Dechloromonas denitrificans]|uniref:hypothetical protein n=1 Tax=Dechloromonas denitrificans TaxID=281362 RepID=UPI001CF823F9|nr:hypothetical protein [Dechloromonas denitrificans]UCV02531.1 hypothetical protein KI611_15795 [Dechloromonas denitrificans]UCV06829.1 hypothetical protein KI615_15680 [Dechloromonas denitrificans]